MAQEYTVEQLNHGRKVYDFMRWDYWAFGISGLLLIAAIVIMGVRGFNWGLDFTGGTVIEITLEKPAEIDVMRDALQKAGFEEPMLQNFGSSHDIMVRMPPAEGETGGQVLGSQVLKVINESTNQNAAVKRIEFVGPSVGADLAQTGAMALMAALLSILVYVGFRFEWRLAAGVVIALAQKIADELGVKLEVQDMNFQALLTSLTGGKVDIAIAGINPTEERKKSMDFSADYLPTEQKVIIRKEDGSRYKKLEDLFGKTVGVQKSTTQEALAKEKIKDAKIVSLAHVPEVVLELKQGKVDGLVVEGIVGGQYLVFNDDLMFSEVEFPNSVKSSAAAVQKGNEDVVAVVNKVIKENTDNGNFKKWTDEYSRKAVENADKQ